MERMQSRTFAVQADGFTGMFYPAETRRYFHKTLIVMGGSDGSFAGTKKLAQKFSSDGMDALALAYWREPGLPGELKEVPVEFVENAVKCLRARGNTKVGIYGISKGAELALVAASLIPDITCCVAVSPICCVCMGLKKHGAAECSSWTWRGRPLPYLPGKMKMGGVLKRLLTEQQFDISFIYRKLLSNAPEGTYIKAENIKGPVLLISAGQDAIWPSKYSGQRIMDRLDARRFSYPHQHLVYEKASHFLIPFSLPEAKVFKAERKYPKECAESRRDAYEKILAFLQNNW